MGKSYQTFVKQFSAIEGVQEEYTLEYSLDAAEAGQCSLMLRRTGSRECTERMRLSAAPEYGYRMLKFMFENAVQPEIWLDVAADLTAQLFPAEKGGVCCGR